MRVRKTGDPKTARSAEFTGLVAWLVLDGRLDFLLTASRLKEAGSCIGG